MAEVPERIENMFINPEVKSKKGISDNGIYAIKLYALMMPIVVTIDDKIPVKKGTRDETWHAPFGEDGSVWAPLLEKAMAYMYGNYEAVDNGLTGLALQTLAGSPLVWTWNNAKWYSDFWEELSSLPDNAMVHA